MLMIFGLQPMILTYWLRQSKYCLAVFDMKNLREASFALGIQILRDRPGGIMRLSQQTNIERILKMFNMQLCSSGKASIVKGDRFNKGQYPQNDIERDQMKAVPYSLVVCSLMHAQICTYPYIAFLVSLLGRYLSEPGQSH